MSQRHRIAGIALFVCACSTAAVVSNVDPDATSGDAEAGLQDSATSNNDSAMVSDANAVGEFGAIDRSWPVMEGISAPNGSTGAMAASPQGLGATGFNSCVFSEGSFESFDEYTPTKVPKDVEHVCWGTRNESRALAYLADAGAGIYILASSSGRNLQLQQIARSPSAADGGLRWVFPQNQFSGDGGIADYSANAMVAESDHVRIAAESSKQPSHAIALTYGLNLLIDVNYEDLAMKTYLAVATAPSGIHYAGESVGGNVAVRRLASGLPDATFGNGGLAELTHAGAAGSVAVDSMGRVLIAATTASNTIFVMRLTSNGALDTSFNGGRIDLPLATTFEERIGMAIEPSGSVVVGGLSASEAGTGPAVWLSRISPDAHVTLVHVSSKDNAPTANRVALTRDTTGYFYVVALTGTSTLRRVHW